VKWGQFKVLKAIQGFFSSAKTDQRRVRTTLGVEGEEFNRMFDTFQRYGLVFHKQTASQKSWKV